MCVNQSQSVRHSSVACHCVCYSSSVGYVLTLQLSFSGALNCVGYAAFLSVQELFTKPIFLWHWFPKLLLWAFTIERVFRRSPTKLSSMKCSPFTNSYCIVDWLFPCSTYPHKITCIICGCGRDHGPEWRVLLQCMSLVSWCLLRSVYYILQHRETLTSTSYPCTHIPLWMSHLCTPLSQDLLPGLARF